MRVISLSLVSILSLSTAIIAGDDIKPTNTEVIEIEEPKESFGTLSGQFRTFYIDRTYTGILENNRNSLNTGGHIGYDTKSFNGLSLGLRAYGTYGFEIHDEDKSSKKYDPSLFGDDFDDYAFIGQAYLNYKNGNTNIKIGRQRLDTPLAGADDARMLPNLFEAVIISNTDLADTTLIAGHVTKETVGTFGNVYGEAGALSLQSGYGLGYKLGTSGEFATMGEIALGEGADTDGVSALAFIYTGVEGLKLQAWDYYAHDILNALYLQADYKYSGVTASAQYINETDTGDALAGEVDSNYLGFKLGTTYQNLSGYVAYSMTDSSDASMNGGILTPWGGMPAFTQAMATRHQFFADTDTSKVAVTYDFKDTGLDIKATAFYVDFDIGEKNSYVNGTAWSASEAGFDIKYNPSDIKGLNLRFRGNFPRDFKPGLDWAEYRFIVNYNF